MNAPAVVIGLSLAELAKFALQMYFAQLAMAGKTAEEMDAMYKATKEQFFDRHPSKLKDV